MIFFKALTAGLMASLVAAKEVSGVFTAINSITKNSASTTQTPFGYYDVVVAWLIDTSEVTTGDTFSLEMPYVFEVRNIVDCVAKNSFDIKHGGETFASLLIKRLVERSRLPSHAR